VIATGRRAKLAVAEDAFDVRLRPVDGSAPVALLAGEVLTVTGASADGGNDSSRTWPVLRADGTAGTVTAPSDRVRAVPAADGETEVSEPTVTAAPAGDDMLVLLFPLVQAYDRGSVRFAANVAPGSHGETRTEVLGSGDASTTLQSFTLTVPPDPATGRAPLTYLRSTVPGGATSTLSVVVDGLAWQEAPSLLDAGSRDRVYVVGLTADGRVQVSFGDGVTGARLPTGSGNVTATYRVGTGLAGSVPADRITLLLTRPLGVRSVTNPLPAGLAEDPETADVTRRMAPRTVVSLNRVVSLADYTEAARSFAGIAKAVATWAWDGRTRLIRITVAGTGGRAVDDATRKALVASLIVTGDPFQRVSVIDHLPQPVDVTTTVIAAPGQQTTPLQAAVTAALAGTFSFDRRDFDQPITAAEVAAVIQAVPGVQGVSALTVTSGSTQETASPVASVAARGATGAATLATVRTLEVTMQGAS
jgi:predicted phage baseplate assembly protein